MTRFERIAQTWPLHAQRIAELTSGDSGWMRGIGPPWLEQLSEGARRDLIGAFEFICTEEGHDYWWTLYERAPT